MKKLWIYFFACLFVFCLQKRVLLLFINRRQCRRLTDFEKITNYFSFSISALTKVSKFLCRKHSKIFVLNKFMDKNPFHSFTVQLTCKTILKRHCKSILLHCCQLAKILCHFDRFHLIDGFLLSYTPSVQPVALCGLKLEKGEHSVCIRQ